METLVHEERRTEVSLGWLSDPIRRRALNK